MDGAISQSHSIRNGYNRSSNTIPRHNNHKSNWTAMPWQLQQQATHAQHYVLQQQQKHQHKSTTGSESGSSTGDMSPPPPQQQQLATAIDVGMQMHGNQSQSSGLRAQALNLSRLNGANVNTTVQQQQSQQPQHGINSSNSLEFNGSPVSVGSGGGATLVTSNSSGNLLLVGAPMHNFPTYRNIPGTTTIQRQFPAQVNGEITLYPFNAGPPFINITTQQQAQSQQLQQQTQRVSPSQTPPVLLPTPFPTNKLVQSCFNCGSINHTGLNCSEASMEDVTRNAVYKLDFTVSTQSNLPFTPALMMTSSSSMGNLNVANNNNNNTGGNSGGNNNNSSSNNNNNPETQLEPLIPFIDLTQDTSSDSSISNR
jgi:hypothetical protein